jgi:hypothetical protein
LPRDIVNEIFQNLFGTIDIRDDGQETLQHECPHNGLKITRVVHRKLILQNGEVLSEEDFIKLKKQIHNVMLSCSWFFENSKNLLFKLKEVNEYYKALFEFKLRIQMWDEITALESNKIILDLVPDAKERIEETLRVPKPDFSSLFTRGIESKLFHIDFF